jgi:hypothetical protein
MTGSEADCALRVLKDIGVACLCIQGTQGTLKSEIVHAGYKSMVLDTVRVLGVSKRPQSAIVNSAPAVIHYHEETQVRSQLIFYEVFRDLMFCWQLKLLLISSDDENVCHRLGTLLTVLTGIFLHRVDFTSEHK